MSGHPPPDADDYHEVSAGEADEQGTDAATRLSVVSAFLASVPAPVLPPHVSTRISAAIAAEAAARAAAGTNGTSSTAAAARDAAPHDQGPAAGSRASDSPAAVGAVRSRTLGRPPRHARVRRPGRVFRLSGTLAAVCLVLAGLGFLLSHSPGSSSSSAAASGSAAGPAAASASSAAGSTSEAGPASGTKRISAAGPGAPRPAASASRTAPFTVTESGTAYQKAALAGQVRSITASRAASGGTGGVPSAALLGCVLKLTDAPTLVDRATYQGTPAYVIASASRVWVVGRGCTASAPEVMASVPLAG